MSKNPENPSTTNVDEQIPSGFSMTIIKLSSKNLEAY